MRQLEDPHTPPYKVHTMDRLASLVTFDNLTRRENSLTVTAQATSLRSSDNEAQQLRFLYLYLTYLAIIIMYTFYINIYIYI